MNVTYFKFLSGSEEVCEMWKRVSRQRERLTPSLSVSHPELHIFSPSPF